MGATRAALLKASALKARLDDIQSREAVAGVDNEVANESFTVLQVVKATYDFAVDGGAVSAIERGEDFIPSGWIVVGGFIQVSTAITGGATVAVHVQTANDIQTAAADSGAPWSTTGLKAITPKANTPESTGIALTARRKITATITTAAITAGKFSVYLYCVPGE